VQTDKLKAVVFDLVNTLGHFTETVNEVEASLFLVDRGYEIYSQTFKHALGFTVRDVQEAMNPIKIWINPQTQSTS
jgi:hypothetical protein